MMKTTAQDVMTTRFHTLMPSISIEAAVKQFKQASQEERRKVFGMMVTDEDGRLVGMLSMYDILLLKYKVNALLTTDEEDKPGGVISKSDSIILL